VPSKEKAITLLRHQQVSEKQQQHWQQQLKQREQATVLGRFSSSHLDKVNTRLSLIQFEA
jgi:hypothetical protein